MLHMMYIFCKSFQWYVASILKKMFHLFLTYVAASVLSGCCIRFTHVASVLSRCSIRFTHMLQVFYLDIAYVLHTCCKRFIWMLNMFHTYVVTVCFKCFFLCPTYVASKCFMLQVFHEGE
jgi:hypothetical protein